MERQKVVVVGAGPVGALAALYAASRGDNVEIYELRGGIFPLRFLSIFRSFGGTLRKNLLPIRDDPLVTTCSILWLDLFHVHREHILGKYMLIFPSQIYGIHLPRR